MEATATIKERVREGVELRRRLDAEMAPLERSRTSMVAGQIRDQLDKAQTTFDNDIDGIMADSQEVVRRVEATVALIPLTKPSLKRDFSSIIVEAKHQDLILPDNLIVHCILDHSRRHPAASKAFLSGNSFEYSRPAVQAALKAGGIDKYFSEAKNVMDWYRS